MGGLLFFRRLHVPYRGAMVVVVRNDTMWKISNLEHGISTRRAVKKERLLFSRSFDFNVVADRLRVSSRHQNDVWMRCLNASPQHPMTCC